MSIPPIGEGLAVIGQDLFQLIQGKLRPDKMDGPHAKRPGSRHIFLKIVQENGLGRGNAQLVERNPVYADIRFHHPGLGRDGHGIKGIIKSIADDPRAQARPGVADEADFVGFTQRAHEIQQVEVGDIAGEKFIMDGLGL